MSDREKVKKGLECHKIDEMNRINCSDCPYGEEKMMKECLNNLHDDALALLEKQERIIKQYQKADGFLFAHGWKWEGR